MAKLNEKLVNDAVSEAIKSSKNHAEAMRKAIVFVVQWSAMHGRLEPLTKLFHGVSQADRETIRIWRINLSRSTFGGKYYNADGKAFATDFLGYDKAAKSFVFAKSGDEEKSAAFKACREAVSKADVADLMAISLDMPGRDDGERQERAFDFWSSVAKLIKRGVAEGVSITELNSVNRLIPDPEHRVAIEAERKRVADSIKSTRDRLAKLEKAFGEKPTTTSTETPSAETATESKAA